MQRFALLLPAFLLLPLPLMNQVGSTIICTNKALATTTVSSEGLNELIGGTEVTCSGLPVTPSGQPVQTGTFIINLNIPVGNGSALSADSPWTDAALTIGSPPTILAAPVDDSSGLSLNTPIFGTGAGIDFSSPGVFNQFSGRRTGVNRLEFGGIPLEASPIGTTQTFRFTRIRGNANWAVVDGAGVGQVNLSLLLLKTGGTGVPITPASVLAGTVRPSLNPRVITGFARHCFPYNTGLLQANPVAPAGFSSVILFDDNSNAFPVGTRLRATINNLAVDTPAFTDNAWGSTGGTKASLVNPTPSASGITRLNPVNGTAVAEWNVTQLGNETRPTPSPASAGINFGFSSGGTLSTSPRAPNHITVSLGYGDQTIPGVPYPIQFAPSPVPPQDLFSINSCTGNGIQMSARIDPRACVIGGFYDARNNACTAPDGFRIRLETDDNSVSANGAFGATSSNAVGGSVFGELLRPRPDFLAVPQITSNPLNGSTPLNGALVLSSGSAQAAPGTYPGTFTFSATGSQSLTVASSITVLGSTTPVITSQGFDDVGTYRAGTVSPGQIFVIFGQNFGPATGVTSTALDSAGKLPNTAGGVQITFDGVPAPLLYVAKNQIAGVAPFGIRGKTTTRVILTAAGQASPPLTLPVTAATISVLSADASGGGSGAVLNTNGSLNTPGNPAAAGSIVVLYVSYAGPLNVNGTDGRTTTAAPYPAPTGTPSVIIGGVPATDIKYFGNAPTFLESVIQVNVTVPASVKPGSNIPVVVKAGGATSPPWTTIAVKAP